MNKRNIGNSQNIEKFIRRDSEFAERRSITESAPSGGIRKETNITLTKMETGETKPKDSKG